MKTLIIPHPDTLTRSLALAARYNSGFEYNDFFIPDVLDNEEAVKAVTEMYKRSPLPDHCTVHGAFFDVTVFSPDKRIREISRLRVEQSISAARGIGAGAVIFHTNYNPFLNSREYISSWLEQNRVYWAGVAEAHSDMNIYLENMFDSSPYIMAELAKGLKGYENFGICLDYAHASLTKVPPHDWVTSLGEYVRHIHINDNDLHSDLHLAVGEGRINWNEFYSLYEKHMNGASVLVETSSPERQEASLKKLEADGFLKL